jgi:hypothetical protein
MLTISLFGLVAENALDEFLLNSHFLVILDVLLIYTS